MLVWRKGSKKKKRGIYEACPFGFSGSFSHIQNFLGSYGKLKIGGDYSVWIETKDNRKVGPGQIMLKDNRQKKILTFDPTIFYDWFEQINYGSGS